MNETYIKETTEQLQKLLADKYVISNSITHKNNGVVLHGINITSPDEAISPVMYLEHYHDKGLTPAEAAEMILYDYRIAKEQQLPIDVSQITDYETIKEKIYFKLINTELNKELLLDAPHISVLGDLSCVFYIDLDSNASITIRNALADKWHVSRDGLFTTATENARNNWTIEFDTITNILIKQMDIAALKIQFGEYDMTDDEFRHFFAGFMDSNNPCPLYVLRGGTEHDSPFGASALLCSKAMEIIKAGIKQDKFIILPSSVHEMLIVPYSAELSISQLKETVKSVNQTEVSETDKLSDNIYFYDGKDIHLITDEIERQMRNDDAR